MKKPLVLTICLFAAMPCLAATQAPTPSTDYCNQISGVWEGSYQDPTGLFINKPFPIKLALQKNGSNSFYGYTMKSSDNKGANFGKQAWLVWGTCNNSKITNLYFINPTHKPVCGDPSITGGQLITSKALTLLIPWENAMTGTTFHGNLNKISNKFEVNQGLIDAAQQLSKTQVNTCH